MGKDPAFLFYASNFLTGVAGLTMEERGQYITLMCLQHQNGHLSPKTIRLALGFDLVNSNSDVMTKFLIDSDGNYYNARLEEEIQKRIDVAETHRAVGKLGGRPRNQKDNQMDNQMGGHLGNQTVNTNIDTNTDVITTKEKGSRGKPFTKPTLDEVVSYCTERNNSISGQDFLDYYDARGWILSNGKKMVDWQAAVRTWESRDKQQRKSQAKMSEAERIMTL